MATSLYLDAMGVARLERRTAPRDHTLDGVYTAYRFLVRAGFYESNEITSEFVISKAVRLMTGTRS